MSDKAWRPSLYLWQGYYENLSLCGSVLSGFALTLAQRPYGIGVAAFLAALALLFVTLGAFVYRALLVRDTRQHWYATVIHVYLAMGGAAYFSLLLLLCVPQLTSASATTYTTLDGYAANHSFGDALIDIEHVPLLMVFVTAALIASFVIATLWVIVATNRQANAKPSDPEPVEEEEEAAARWKRHFMRVSEQREDGL
jgi:TRAP-type C4-dicarboxylate transport system permease small subunit